MGWQIIKQPNGKYCIFSSVVDNVIYYNGTRKETIAAFVDDERKRIERRCNEIMDALETGQQPYYQFTKSFDEMIKTISTIHGIKEAKKILKMIDEK